MYYSYSKLISRVYSHLERSRKMGTAFAQLICSYVVHFAHMELIEQKYIIWLLKMCIIEVVSTIIWDFVPPIYAYMSPPVNIEPL